jgi:TRAP-type C4-dicarboxylate transport system permease large subunit
VRGVIPFVLLSMGQLLLITYWSDLSLFLPRLLM